MKRKMLALLLLAALLLAGCGKATAAPDSTWMATETEAPTPEPTAEPAALKAENYIFVEDNCSWTEAQRKALTAGGHLACLETEEELELVLGLLGETGNRDVGYRIGARRALRGEEYYWVDEQDRFYGEELNAPGHWSAPYWLEGEPSFTWDGEQEAYVEIYYDRDVERWVLNDVSDQGYSGSYGYILELGQIVRTEPAGPDEPAEPDGGSGLPPVDAERFEAVAGRYGYELEGYYTDEPLTFPDGEHEVTEAVNCEKWDGKTYYFRLISMENTDAAEALFFTEYHFENSYYPSIGMGFRVGDNFHSTRFEHDHGVILQIDRSLIYLTAESDEHCTEILNALGYEDFD